MKKIIDNIKGGRFTKPIVIRMRGDDEEYAGLILKKYLMIKYPIEENKKNIIIYSKFFFKPYSSACKLEAITEPNRTNPN